MFFDLFEEIWMILSTNLLSMIRFRYLYSK